MAEQTEPTTILVVEDDIHLLSGIRDILELEDYRVLTAQHGVEGLETLRQTGDTPPSVIISDIMMPHMDGFRFLEEVRKEDRWVHVPFIFLTAKGEKTDRHRGSLLGADVYLTKPFDAEDLLVSVSSCLKRHADIRRVKDDQISDVKNKILTILNHEFRTPLTLVIAYADMLKDFDGQNMTNHDVISFLRGVNSGADRLRRLIENFILLVELDSGEAERTMGWRRRPVENIQQLVDEAYRQIAFPDLRPREFVFEYAPNLPVVHIDSQFMTAVIREMLDNAAKFSSEDGRVELSVEADDQWMSIIVRDYGRGIPPDELDNIWQPFYQIDREQFEDQGAGSGLPIIQRLVELHGGQCFVASEVGQGSTFTVRIPVKVPAKA